MKAAEQTNHNLHVLATVTTVFLPASLIVGIFGMNVELPLDQKSGFIWAIAILIAAAAILVVETFRHSWAIVLITQLYVIGACTLPYWMRTKPRFRSTVFSNRVHWARTFSL